MYKYLLIALVLVLHGCASTSSSVMTDVETDKIYNVVIEGEVELTGDVVTETDEVIGEVLSNKTSSSGVSVAKVLH